MFKYDFEVQYYDSNVFGLLEYMQEISTIHTSTVGCTPDYQIEHDIGWILLNTHAKVFRMPKYGEKLHGKTWPCKSDKLFTYRQYEFTDEDGNVVLQASTRWIIYSFAEKSPIRLPQEIIDMYTFEDKEIMPTKYMKFKEPDKCDKTTKYMVLYRDVDTNWHMNNIKYIKYVAESMGAEFLKTHEIHEYDIEYAHQIKHGENFFVCQNKIGENEYIYSIKKEGSDELKPNANIYIKWRSVSESNC